jgi:hypothetical protein
MTSEGTERRKGIFAWSPRRIAELRGWIVSDDDKGLDALTRERRTRAIVNVGLRVRADLWPAPLHRWHYGRLVRVADAETMAEATARRRRVDAAVAALTADTAEPADHARVDLAAMIDAITSEINSIQGAPDMATDTEPLSTPDTPDMTTPDTVSTPRHVDPPPPDMATVIPVMSTPDAVSTPRHVDPPAPDMTTATAAVATATAPDMTTDTRAARDAALRAALRAELDEMRAELALIAAQREAANNTEREDRQDQRTEDDGNPEPVKLTAHAVKIRDLRAGEPKLSQTEVHQRLTDAGERISARTVERWWKATDPANPQVNGHNHNLTSA